MMMDETKFAELARQYIGLLDRQQDMKPSGWSQDDHNAEVKWRQELLVRMREVLS